jgi:hypothetical protein
MDHCRPVAGRGGRGAEHRRRTPRVEHRDIATRTAEGAVGFTYTLALPAEVDTENVDATMDHGLLTVRLPRASSEGPGTTLSEDSERSRPVGTVGLEEVPPADEGPSEA